MPEPTLVYLHDPLCGWCYGAAPAILRLQREGISIRVIPTGLFAGAGARTMDPGLAAYAWANDRRIAELSGQVFSEAYRTKVLGAIAGRFNSAAATLALTAVTRSAAAAREMEALQLIQAGRYVAGLDVTARSDVADIFRRHDLGEAADLLATPDAALRAANEARIAQGRALLEAVGARGVPTLVTASGGVVSSDLVFGDFALLLKEARRSAAA